MFPQEPIQLRRCYSRSALALLTAVVMVQLLAGALVGADYVLHLGWFDSDLKLEILNTAVVYPVTMLFLWLCLRKNPKPRIARSDPPGPGAMAACFVTSLGLLYLGSLITGALLSDTGATDFANDFVDRQPLWSQLVFTVVLGPICEEIAFRGIVLDRLLYLGDWSALLLSSLFFGLFHLNLYQMLYALLVGLVLGYVRIMTGTLRWSIALHMGLNLVCGVAVHYIPESLMDFTAVAVYGCIAAAAVIILRLRPWRQCYAGPMDWFTAGDKLRACLSSVPFWLCLAVTLGLAALNNL